MPPTLDRLDRLDRLDLGSRAGALLAMVEVGLGSLIHGLKIPLGGHLLSLNQGFLLCRVTKEARESGNNTPWLSSTVSNIAAVLKSLSPAGNRLTPMLAISAQGLLFNLSTLTLGRGFLGQSTGMILLALWGFLQPILLYLLFYGSSLVEIGKFAFVQIESLFNVGPELLGGILLGIIGFKILAALTLVFLAEKLPSRLIDRYFLHVRRPLAFRGPQSLPVVNPQKNSIKWAFRGALKDLAHPFFIFSIALTSLFLLYSQDSEARSVWILLRPIAVAFIVYLGFRLFPIPALALRLGNTRFSSFSRSLQDTLAYFRKSR